MAYLVTISKQRAKFVFRDCVAKNLGKCKKFLDSREASGTECLINCEKAPHQVNSTQTCKSYTIDTYVTKKKIYPPPSCLVYCTLIFQMTELSELDTLIEKIDQI